MRYSVESRGKVRSNLVCFRYSFVRLSVLPKNKNQSFAGQSSFGSRTKLLRIGRGLGVSLGFTVEFGLFLCVHGLIILELHGSHTTFPEPRTETHSFFMYVGEGRSLQKWWL